MGLNQCNRMVNTHLNQLNALRLQLSHNREHIPMQIEQLNRPGYPNGALRCRSSQIEGRYSHIEWRPTIVLEYVCAWFLQIECHPTVNFFKNRFLKKSTFVFGFLDVPSWVIFLSLYNVYVCVSAYISWVIFLSL